MKFEVTLFRLFVCLASVAWLGAACGSDPGGGVAAGEDDVDNNGAGNNDGNNAVGCPEGCDDGNPCTVDVCGAQGCEHTPTDAL